PSLDSCMLVPTPPVVLVQVDGRTKKRSRPQRVSLRSHGIAFGRCRRICLPQKARRLRVGFRGTQGGGAEPALKRRIAASIGLGGKGLEERPGLLLAAPRRALIGADQRLASRRHDPPAPPLTQRRLEAGQRL